MTHDEAIHDNSLLDLRTAGQELKRHGCRIVSANGSKITVTNDMDPAETIRCSARAILEWLGY